MRTLQLSATVLGLVLWVEACGRPGTQLQVSGFDGSQHGVTFGAELTDGTLNFLSDSKSAMNPAVIKEFGGDLSVDDQGQIFNIDSRGHALKVGMVEADGTVRFCQFASIDQCSISFGVKRPSQLDGQNLNSVISVNIELNYPDERFSSGGDRVDNLVSLVLASPDQEEAGSCLFMASTGVMEILLNLDPSRRDLNNEGRTDLSERFLMNVGKDWSVDNWRTDSILLFNKEKGAVRNVHYRYTKGWFKDESGSNERAEPNEEGSDYGTEVNWVYELDSKIKANKISVPTVKRSIIFKDPQNNVWNTGVMQPSIIGQVKNHLKQKKSPVLVIYNHYGYWHAAVIVGYDDSKTHGECPMVNNYMETMRTNPVQKPYIERIEEAMEEHNGCSTKGVFIVRDSIYTGSQQNMYDYDLSQKGEERPYSKRLVEHEYEWLLYLGNHAYSVERAQ